LGSPGYPADTRGYPDRESEDLFATDEPWELDLERFLEPREAARMISSDQPIAHEGKAGWAVERSTQRAIWIGGATQWDVLGREPGAPRDEPGLTDLPADGGFGSPAPAPETIRRHASEVDRKRVQVGLKLSLAQAAELDEAAELFGATRTTLARILVVRGAREIVARAKG
jgi:hypothetical protein